MTNWKYMSGGQQYGPVDTEAIIALLRSGTLLPDTQAMKEGGMNWAPLSAFPEFASVTAVRGSTPPAIGAPAGATGALDTSDVDKNKVFAILAYLGILFLVPLLVAKDSKFARYHTNQGVVLFLAGVVLSIGAVILAHIPFLNCLALIIFPVLWICLLVFIVIGIINAANGRYKPLPLIGHFTIIK